MKRHSINKIKIPEGETLKGNKPLLIKLLKHLGEEGSKKPRAARNTAETLLLEYIGEKDLINAYNEYVDISW